VTERSELSTSRGPNGIDRPASSDGTNPPSAPDADEAAPTPLPFPLRVDIRSVVLTGLFLLALAYTAYFARSFLVPVILAVLLEFLFRPLVRRLKRARIPESLTAAVVVLGLVGTLGAGLYTLSAPAAAWMARAPQSLSLVRTRLQKLRRPVEHLARTAEQVQDLTEVGGRSGSEPVKVELQSRTIGQVLFGGTQDLLTSAMVVFVLLYFLLSSGELFLTKLIKVLPTLEDKKRAVQIARQTEDQISQYLISTTVINLAFGVVVGAAMFLLDMPNPVLWGVLAGIANYVPYLGGIVTTVVLALVAVLRFDDLNHALLVPAVFVALNFVEGNLLKPMVVGRQLLLNPVVLFLGVLFWGWIWGIAGSLLAVPLLAALKIACDRIEGLAPIGELLGP
jgi:predicted PurR-regulated permease PerM